MSADDSGRYAALPTLDDAPGTCGRLWILQQMFQRAHEQLDATIDMIDVLDSESDPAPSVPPA
jgi:hypothetical protein